MVAVVREVNVSRCLEGRAALSVMQAAVTSGFARTGPSASLRALERPLFDQHFASYTSPAQSTRGRRSA